MKKKPESITIKTVAERAGVSTATVSHVINSTRFVSEKSKNNVLKAMDDLDYRPSLIARGLRNRKTNIIGVLMPIMLIDNFDYYFMKLAHGVQNKFRQLGYDVILSSYDNTLEDEQSKAEAFYVRSIDGLILLPAEGDHSYLSNNPKISCPVVLIDRKAEKFHCDCVMSDNYRGSAEAVEALIAEGHRNIACISSELNVTTVLDRIQGYKDSLEKADIRGENMIIKRGPFDYQTGYRLTEEVLSGGKEATAIFYTDNVLSMGGLQCLNDRDIAIPDRIAVIGYDDFEWERIVKPPLSVVKQPAYEIGEKAAEVLEKRINQEETEKRDYYLPTELIKRKSF